MKNFALIGAAGYIAPRHFKAIKETGNLLSVALDKNDSVGVIDSFFPQADFFVEFERFDRHVDKVRRKGERIDYVSICSPNYLHDSHIRFALRSGATPICEKPLVLNPWNLEALAELESEQERRICNILQLRLHPAVIALKKEVEQNRERIYDLDLSYITSRGKWYQISWKGDQSRSGGIATNIGIHFFDMLTWIFGDVMHSKVHLQSAERAAGTLVLKNANVRWFLSINSSDLPPEVAQKGKATYRSLKIGEKEFEFSDGFSDLHTESYRKILAGEGFGLIESAPSVELVYQIRNSICLPTEADYHPFLKKLKL